MFLIFNLTRHSKLFPPPLNIRTKINKRTKDKNINYRIDIDRTIIHTQTYKLT